MTVAVATKLQITQLRADGVIESRPLPNYTAGYAVFEQIDLTFGSEEAKAKGFAIKKTGLHRVELTLDGKFFGLFEIEAVED
jgi:hypothetical protein